jgi:hypothetical protein
MKKAEFEQIRQSAEENYSGDVELALAAHLYSPGVIAKVGNIVPPFADAKALGLLKGQYTRLENIEKKSKTKAESKSKSKSKSKK